MVPFVVDELWRPLPDKGKSDALYQRIRGAIEAGCLAQGDKLPSSRELAKALKVSRNVVLRAYSLLEAQGYAEAQQGAATKIKSTFSRDRSASLGRPETPSPFGRPRFDFRFARVAQDNRTQERWIARIRHHAPRSLNRYSDPQGLWDLREQVAIFLARYRRIQIGPEQILLVSGSQQAIDLAGRCFVTPGQSVGVESPAYQGGRQAMELSHLRVHDLPVDAQGLVVDSLNNRSRGEQDSPKMVFCTPSHQIPSGALMSLPRRKALLDWAERTQGLILEDDYDGLPFYSGEPEAPALFGLDTQSRVLHIGTFSLLLFPGIRIGYICGSPSQIETLTQARWLASRQNPELLQAALCDLMQSGEFDLHLRRRRRMLVKKRKYLIHVVNDTFGEHGQIEGDKAGTFMVLGLRTRAPRSLARALDLDPELGWEELPASVGQEGGRVRRLRLVLCYAALSLNQIEGGIERICEYWKRIG